MTRIALAIALSAILIGCTQPVTTTSGDIRTAVAVATSGHEHAQDVTPAATCLPIKVIILIDKSRSAVTSATEPLTLNHLTRILDSIARCGGGTLALGVIDAESTGKFVRFHASARPLPLTRPDDNVPPFERAELEAQFQVGQDRRQAEIAAHDTVVAKDRDEFTRDATPLLEAAPDASRTNIAGAVNRAILYLSEPEPLERSTAGRRWIVLLSDGRDTTGQPLEPLPPDVTVMIATPAGALPPLVAQLNPKRFEAIAPALEYVAQQGETPFAPTAVGIHTGQPSTAQK